MISKYILLITFLNDPELNLFLHSVKWFQVFLCNMNNTICYKSFVCTQLNGSNDFYQTLIILFHINHLFADSEAVTSIAI